LPRSDPARNGLRRASARPGVPLEFGDLQVIPFSGDHVSVNCADEWDALPLLIRDKGGAGSFFTMVDVACFPVHVEWAKGYVSRPCLVTWSNNALDWSHMGEEPAPDLGTEQCLRSMAAGHQLISTAWGKPSAMLICAGGFAFHGEQAWFNQRVFWVDTEAVSRHLSAVIKDERFFSALPGQTFWMEGNRLARVEESTPFLGVAPRPQWPARGPDSARRYSRLPAGDRSSRACRRRCRELRERLNELASALVGGILFRSLHSMLAVEARGRKPTFALVLRHGAHGDVQVFRIRRVRLRLRSGRSHRPVARLPRGAGSAGRAIFSRC
jgi:hypothetical protein